ncbi:MAG: 30S ribosomal protein S14 [Candidatus Micrarchaeota archaeon]|nr:30S ribosomal protein S14 [Candidatus Micrarchaeota archaeon]MDE1804493.1 30S ribosomal protein S14 [Candidatus Micrarchaeota archaeon]MDE1846450.1 30S ribosomal protein S14 [Candidatus Micrarchaeota archaeon]
MAIRYELRQRGKGMRKCKICGGSRALIRSYKLYVCRRCFRENAERLGFEKLS